MRHLALVTGLLLSTVACASSSSGDGAPALGGTRPGGGGLGAAPSGSATGSVSASGGVAGNVTAGGTGAGSTSGGAGIGGANNGGAPSVAGASTGGAQNGGQTGGQSGEATGTSGSGGGGSGGGGPLGSCVGKAWGTADPTKAGPFQVQTEKNVGPLAGVVPDPIYGDKQQRFNVYRPSNLDQTGYCHPILIWANGYRDNPEQNPPDCVVDSGANRWCGQYGPMVKHLASHGFVVVAPLSTATAEGTPLPTIASLDWILEQAEDSSSPYYHHLDTANIGQLGHSYGGMSTCISASEPRYKALATICGTRALTGVHTPMLFFCGGKDTTVDCEGVKTVFQSVTNQPAFFLKELSADHGSWVYQGANGVSLSSAVAWFRVHLMNDSANRKYFYGSGCTFCTDNRAEAEQNSLMK